MSRAVVEPTADVPTVEVRPAGTGPESPGRRRLALALSGVLVLATVPVPARVATHVATDRVDAIDHDTAVALEAGVRPLVSDRIGELGTIESVTVTRTPDPEPARVHLVGPPCEARPLVSVVSAPGTADLAVDGRLGDGRPYHIYNADDSNGRYVSLATVGASGQRLDLMGRDMPFERLLRFTTDIDVDRDGVVRLPAGWTELGDGPMPPWHDGFSTSYELLGGRELRISVERATPGREVLAAFAATTEAIDLGTGEWAYRYRPPSAGVIFRRGDLVVDLTGSFSEAELLIVVHSLREMRRDEHPILPPDPYPF